MLHFQHSKICPNLNPTTQRAYIVTVADCNYGRLFLDFYNVSQCFYDAPNTSLFDNEIIVFHRRFVTNKGFYGH